MIDFEPHMVAQKNAAPKNHFPILLQLGILSLFMFLIFGSILWRPPASTGDGFSPTITTDNKKYPLTPQKIDEVPLTAKAAYVWDVKGQRALYNKNSETALPLASITKLMTALLAHELIAGNETTTISLSAILQEGSSGLAVGEEFNIDDLTELALISSSNDAAYALAASVGELLGNQDPASQFIKGMNIRAKELGLTSLSFSNTTGLDLSETVPGSVGSAKDVSFLMEYIITNYPEIIAPTQETSTKVYNTEGEYHEAENTNSAVSKIPNLIGSKTGYTDLAGGNLTVAFDAGLDRPIVITVLGSTREDRFTDVLRLIEEVQKSLTP